MSNTYTESKSFISQDYRTDHLPKGEYEYCDFNACLFSESDLSHIVFIECTFTECDFSLCKLYETSFQQVEFINCKMIGIYFDQLNTFLLEMHFKGSTLDHSSFFGLSLVKSSFEGESDRDFASLNNVDFTNSNLSGITLMCCNLLGSKFENTNLSKTDLSTSLDFDIDPEINNIQESIVSQTELGNFLTKYNLKLT